MKEEIKTRPYREAGKVQRRDVRELTVTALFIALTYVATAFINIKIFPAAGGLVHLGNVPLFIAAVLFGRRTGALAGAVGMALFDITSSYMAWAPFTFVIVGLMGYVVGRLTEGKKTVLRILLGMAAALAIKIAGYYAAEVIITGNFMVPVASVPGNIIQVATAALLALPLIIALKPVLRLKNEKEGQEYV